jgi:hypothetical protein
MVPERRKDARKTPAEFTFIQLEQEHGGRVLNFSQKGLCFECLSPINDTDLIQFWFSYLTARILTASRLKSSGHCGS